MKIGFSTTRFHRANSPTRQLFRIMKITGILLLAVSLQLSAKVHSQRITYSAKNVSLQRVFSEIIKQTGLTVIYEEEAIKNTPPVSIEIRDGSVEEVLKMCLKNQPFKYSIDGSIISIEPLNPTPDMRPGLGKDNLPGFFAVTATPVKGYVTDGDGNALVGATVTVKNANTSAKTTGDGSFVINASAGDVLVISYVGYDVKEVKLGASSVKNGMIGTIEMVISPTALRSVEVNKGYYTVKDELNTGNVFTVKGDEIHKQPVSDPMLALEGRVPGLMISQMAGVPGAPLKIQLRGKNFISDADNVAANDPLYIVDGIPFSSQSFLSYNWSNIIPNPTGNSTRGGGISPFNLLNTADIENIEVLKDADATAIYGSRGANGVIIITTRKGKPGKTRFDINLSQGYSKQTITTKLLNTRQYLEMMHEAYKNDGLVYPSITTNPYDYNYDINGLWDTTRNTDWSKELMQKAAVFTNLQSSLSGGSANTHFLINGGYTKQGTYFPGNYSDQKGSLHFNIDHRSTDQRLHINLSGSYSNNTSNIPGGPSLGIINQYAPDAPAIYDAKGNINWQVYQGAATWSNPMAYIHQYSKTLSNSLNGNLTVSYQLLKNLSLKTNFSYQTVQSTQQVVQPSTTSPPPNNTDPNSRFFNFSTTNTQNWNNETQLNYNLKLGKSNFEALAGTTIQNSKGNSLAYGTKGFSSDALITNARSASTYTLFYTGSPEYKFASLYTRIGYNWDEKYIINFTGRRDGSSRFGPGRQFGNFGAAGMGWIFSKETFIQQSFPWLSFGKLRASYGVTGSDGISDYRFLSVYASPGAGTYMGQTLLVPTSLTDSFYRWQRNKKLDIAIELGFVQDRIKMSINYYRNRSDNQLVFYGLTYTTGFGSVVTNLPALVQNSGWEAVLQTLNTRNKNFSWNTSFNLSIPESKLVSYPGIEQSTYATHYSVGKSLFSKLVYHYLGVDPQTGMYAFSGKRGDGLPDYYPQDNVWSKPITQQYYGGISNTIAYKGFSLDFFIQFVKQRGYSYQQAVFQFAPGYAMQNQPEAVMNRWQKPGDISSVQKLTTGYADYLPTITYQQFIGSDGVITDASFIRLKTVNLSYQLSQLWQQKSHLQNARIYLQCQNLFTLTKYQVLDPETQNLQAPVKTLTAGIQLTF